MKIKRGTKEQQNEKIGESKGGRGMEVGLYEVKALKVGEFVSAQIKSYASWLPKAAEE